MKIKITNNNNKERKKTTEIGPTKGKISCSNNEKGNVASPLKIKK